MFASRDPGRIAGLDLLRAAAIVWVMLFHSFLVGGLGTSFDWLSRFGWAGVDMFFVLSGYLIATPVLRSLQQGEGLSVRTFYARRAWRTLPAFAVVLTLYAVFPLLREAKGMQPWWQFATFTMNLLADYTRNQAFSHAWSLCVEEHFYLVFPVLALALMRRPSATRFIVLCASVVLVGIALRGTVWLHDAALDPPRNWFIEDIYYPTWMRLDGLLAGVMLAALRVHRARLWARLQARANACLAAGLVLSALALWMFSDRTGLLANTFGWPLLSSGFALVVVAGSTDRGALGRWRLPGVGWIATISYSLYLIHKIAFHVVERFVAPWVQVSGLLRFALYAVAALAAGAALHYLVERPCLRWRDRLAQAPTPSTSTVTT